LAGTLLRGGTLSCGTDNATCHTKDSAHDIFFKLKKIKILKKLKKLKISEDDTWHTINDVNNFFLKKI